MVNKFAGLLQGKVEVENPYLKQGGDCFYVRPAWAITRR
ncbi:hypothetical protein JOD02_000804 [Caldicoprobacter guelmensis]|nr:hypothetical protein [Caldicoprobacter guelmensis]